jgi:hypothetical protein
LGTPVPYPGCFEGDDTLLPAVTTAPPSTNPRENGGWLAGACAAAHGATALPRVRAALLLSAPERWRANSTLSFYYKIVCHAGGGPVVVEYAHAMAFSAASPEPVVVVPLFRQVARPPRGARLGVPFQFAADMATAGAGGLAFEESHVAVAYFSALQALAHAASACSAPDAALPAFFTVIKCLLGDLGFYAGGMQPVAAVVEHLRATQRAEDVLQWALSAVVAREPFSLTERFRLLETSLKRTMKLHRSILEAPALGRLLATNVLAPILFGVHRGLMEPEGAAVMFAVARARVTAAGAAAAEAVRRQEEGGGAPGGSGDGAAHPVVAAPPGAPSAAVASLLAPAGLFAAGDPGLPGLVAAFGAAPPAGSLERILVAGISFKVSLRTKREAELLDLILRCTGVRVESLQGLTRLLDFCTQREPVFEEEGDEEEEEVGGGAAASVAPDGRSVVSASSRGSKGSKGSKTSSTSTLFSAAKGAEVAAGGSWRDAAKSRDALNAAVVAADAAGGGGGRGVDARSVSSGDSRGSRGSRGWNFAPARGGWKPQEASRGASGGGGAAPSSPPNRFEEFARAGRAAGGSSGGGSGGSGRARSPQFRVLKPEILAPRAASTLALVGGAAPAPPPRKPLRWKVLTLGQFADLPGFGLVAPPSLPFSVGTAVLYKGAPRAGTALAAAAEAAAVAARPLATTLSSSLGTGESDSQAGGETETPFADGEGAGAGGFGATMGTVTVLPEFSSVPAAGTPLLDAVVVTTAPDGGAGACPPLHLVFLLDESGSMSGDKLAAVHAVMRLALSRMRECDKVGIVGFESDARTILPLTAVAALGAAGAARDAAIEALVSQIHANGGTYIASALRTGAATLGAFVAAAGGADVVGPHTSAMLLLTDGQSSGAQPLAPLPERARAELSAAHPEPAVATYYEDIYALRQQGVTLSTLGFGADHEPTLLAGLASALGGTFSYVESTAADAVESAFMAVMGALQTIVTRAAALRLRAPPGTRIAALRSGAYAHAVDADGRGASVAFGALSAGERREVVVSLSLPDVEEAGSGTDEEHPLLEAEATFPTVEEAAAGAAGAAATARAAVSIRRGAEGPSPHPAGAVRVDVARNRERVAAALGALVAATDGGDYAAAAAGLSAAINDVAGSTSAEAPETQALLEELQTLRARCGGASGGMDRGGRAIALAAVASHSKQVFAGGGGGGGGGGVGAAASAYMAVGARALLGGGGGFTGGTGFRRGAPAPFARFSAFNATFCAEAAVRAVAGAVPPAVRAVGTLTTSWSAFSLPLRAEQRLRIALRRLGLGADTPVWVAPEEEGAEWDPREEGLVAAAGGGCGASVAASRTSAALPRAATARATLAVGLRLTSGRVLFGGAPGATFSHGTGSVAPRATGESDADVAWDLGAPLLLDFSAALGEVVICREGDEATQHRFKVPFGAELAVGLLNAVATLSWLVA